MRTILTTLLLCGALGGAALAAEAPEGAAWTDCTVSSVVAYRDHLLVRCGGAGPAPGLQGATDGPPREFAIEAVGPLADPVLRLAIEAKGRGRPLAILYVSDTVSNPAGCAVERCRRIVAVELK